MKNPGKSISGPIDPEPVRYPARWVAVGRCVGPADQADFRAGDRRFPSRRIGWQTARRPSRTGRQFGLKNSVPGTGFRFSLAKIRFQARFERWASAGTAGGCRYPVETVCAAAPTAGRGSPAPRLCHYSAVPAQDPPVKPPRSAVSRRENPCRPDRDARRQRPDGAPRARNHRPDAR